jgi:hypothetical protein
MKWPDDVTRYQVGNDHKLSGNRKLPALAMARHQANLTGQVKQANQGARTVQLPRQAAT